MRRLPRTGGASVTRVPRAVGAFALTAVCLAAAAGCGDGEGDPQDGRATTSGATAPASLAERVADHLLANGARRARADHPGRYWFRGSLILPAGGPTCAVAGVAEGAHAPLVTDAVYDASGTVSVRMRAAPAHRARCLEAARRALTGFAAGPED